MGFSQGIMPNKSSFVTGNKDLADAATAEQLSAASVPVPDGCQLTVIAKPGNTGNIHFGNSKDNAEAAAVNFDGLEPGLAISLKVNDANLVWIKVENNDEGVSYYVEQ